MNAELEIQQVKYRIAEVYARRELLKLALETGMSPLMLATLKGKRLLVEELLGLGADPNHVNDDDHHALWFACVYGDPDLASLLIAHGANVDNQNVNGATCAIYTASTGKLDVLQRLVQAGADLAKETSGGYTALESASTLSVLKFLRGLAVDRRTLSAAEPGNDEKRGKDWRQFSAILATPTVISSQSFFRRRKYRVRRKNSSPQASHEESCCRRGNSQAQESRSNSCQGTCRQ